jgi:hypothetical protein
MKILPEKIQLKTKRCDNGMNCSHISDCTMAHNETETWCVICSTVGHLASDTKIHPTPQCIACKTLNLNRSSNQQRSIDHFLKSCPFGEDEWFKNACTKGNECKFSSLGACKYGGHDPTRELFVCIFCNSPGHVVKQCASSYLKKCTKCNSHHAHNITCSQRGMRRKVHRDQEGYSGEIIGATQCWEGQPVGSVSNRY